MIIIVLDKMNGENHSVCPALFGVWRQMEQIERRQTPFHDRQLHANRQDRENRHSFSETEIKTVP